MYQPPMGRPISSPPAEYINGHTSPRGADKFTVAERESLRADYLAGMSWPTMISKYNTYNAAIGLIIEGLPRRQNRRNLLPQEMAHIIAQYRAGISPKTLAKQYNCHHTTIYRVLQTEKVQPMVATNSRPTRLDGESRHAYANRVQQWMRENDPEWAARWKARNSAAVRRYWKKRRAQQEREAAKRQTVAPSELVPVAPPPPPTFWQRYFGWLWS